MDVYQITNVDISASLYRENLIIAGINLEIALGRATGGLVTAYYCREYILLEFPNFDYSGFQVVESNANNGTTHIYYMGARPRTFPSVFWMTHNGSKQRFQLSTQQTPIVLSLTTDGQAV